ncbi:MAG: hypothetical protein J6A16_00225 [Oscillospiraceae bacterium]|nr:hypothetical protein [Oscillospiraceae bacterium]
MRMSIRPKGKAGYIFLAIAIVIGIAVACYSGIAHSRSATRIGYIGNNGWDSWNGTYQLLDGNMKRTLHFNSNDHIILETATSGGSLSIKIQDTQGNTIFSKNNMETGSHDITVSGNVIITISADKHSGSFSIKHNK